MLTPARLSPSTARRIVCHFSCGAASAVATKLAIETEQCEIVIINAYIEQEHPDNHRFLADCERWFGREVVRVRSDRYDGSTFRVWREERYMNGPFGASCSGRLKREVIELECLSTDRHCFGFTIEEKDRAQRFLDTGALCPLIDRNLTKADCLAIVERAGIRLPEMYRLGYNNANCVGCIKGGMGYWNKVRVDFPERFAEVARIEQEIGEGAFLFYDRHTRRRFSLLELDPNEGRHDITVPECSLFCALAEDEIG